MESLISKVTKWAREAHERRIAKAERNKELIRERERRGMASFEIESHKRFRRLDFYPGSLLEYSSLVGAECEIVDTGRQDKGVTIDMWWNPNDSGLGSYDYICNYHGDMQRVIRDGQIYKKLLEQGVCGLIHGYWLPGEWTVYFGVPVRKKS